jgi:hypothetical protein
LIRNDEERILMYKEKIVANECKENEWQLLFDVSKFNEKEIWKQNIIQFWNGSNRMTTTEALLNVVIYKSLEKRTCLMRSCGEVGEETKYDEISVETNYDEYPQWVLRVSALNI